MTAIHILRFGAFRAATVLIGLLPCAACDDPESPRLTGQPGDIEQVATLRSARAAHTATTLASGQVLFVGGFSTGERRLASIELFDPANNTIRELSPLSKQRSGHTATRLGDGRVLIAGGYNGEYSRSIELFDPSIGRFESAGSLIEPRSDHTATLLPDGQVLFIGGVGVGWTFLRTAELYDPATGRSEAVGSMVVPRNAHTATLLADGAVLVVGGHSGRREAMEVYASAETFDPRTRRFASAGALATARHKHDAVRLADGRVLVIGGADRTDRVFYATTEIYNPSTGRFESGPTMAERRYKMAGTSVLLPNGDVLVTSGARSAEILEHGSGTFQTVGGRFPNAYRFATATSLPNGDVLIAGGYADGVRNTAGVWRFRSRDSQN